LIRVTKPGGHMIFSVRTDVYEDNGFREKQEALEREQKWQLLETTEPFAHLRFGRPQPQGSGLRLPRALTLRELSCSELLIGAAGACLRPERFLQEIHRRLLS
jgi:hypothetical protein